MLCGVVRCLVVRCGARAEPVLPCVPVWCPQFTSHTTVSFSDGSRLMRRERLARPGLSASSAWVCAAQDRPAAASRRCTGGDSISPSMYSRVRRLLRKTASCSAEMAEDFSSSVGDSMWEALAEGVGSALAEVKVVVGARMSGGTPRGEAPASGVISPSARNVFMISSSWPSTPLVTASAIATLRRKVAVSKAFVASRAS